MISAQRVPEPDPLPDIFLDTRPDPIQFWNLSGSGNSKYRVLPDILGKPEEIPELPRKKQNTQKYPIINSVPGNTRSNMSTLLPDPTRPATRLFCPIPTRPDIEKPYPLGSDYDYTQCNEKILIPGRRRSSRSEKARYL